METRDIVDLFMRKTDYFNYFKRVVEAEEEYLERNRDGRWGWRPSDAGIPAHVIKTFLEYGIVEKVFSSRRYRIYRLAIPIEKAKEIIRELESKPMVSYDDIVVYAQVNSLHPSAFLKVLEYVDNLLSAGRLREAIRIYENVTRRLDRILKLYYKASKSKWSLLREKARVLKAVLDKALEIAVKIDEEMKNIEEMPAMEVAKKLGYTRNQG